MKQNFVSSDFKQSISSYGDSFAIGELVGNTENKETATILSFEIDKESNEVKAVTDKGWQHIDFLSKL